MSETTILPASLLRRLAAMIYDGLLLFAVLIVIGVTMLLFTKVLGIPSDNIFLTVYEFGVLYLFLCWFWTHGGQTLGMRAWKIRLVQDDARPVSWLLGLFYYLVSLPMWGFLLFAFVVNDGIYPAPSFIAHVPHWLLYVVALGWFVVDHLPNNWRQMVAGLKMVHIQ